MSHYLVKHGHSGSDYQTWLSLMKVGGKWQRFVNEPPLGAEQPTDHSVSASEEAGANGIHGVSWEGVESLFLNKRRLAPPWL